MVHTDLYRSSRSSPSMPASTYDAKCFSYFSGSSSCDEAAKCGLELTVWDWNEGQACLRCCKVQVAGEVLRQMLGLLAGLGVSQVLQGVVA